MALALDSSSRQTRCTSPFYRTRLYCQVKVNNNVPCRRQSQVLTCFKFVLLIRKLK